MAPGSYVYNFIFKLPDQGLPSSFEGNIGATRYWIKVEIDKTFTKKFYKGFTVLAHIDVNEYNYRLTASANESKPLSKAFGIGNAGTLSLTANLDRNGYCPGEHIFISLVANNESTKTLGRVKAHLIQRVDYSAITEKKFIRRFIQTLEGTKLEKGQKIVWDNERLPISAVSPSTKDQTCTIIKVTYCVKVEVQVPLGLDLEIHFPITIGTAPLGTPIPPHARHIGENLYLTDKSRSIDYARCNPPSEPFTYLSHGCPDLGFFTPLTVFVNDFNPVQALANLQVAAGGTPSSGEITALDAKPQTADTTEKADMSTGVNTLAPTITSLKNQQAVSSTGTQNNAFLNSPFQAAATLQTTTSATPPHLTAAPPSYEEVCKSTPSFVTPNP